MTQQDADTTIDALPQLWELAGLARQSQSDRELGFLLANQSLCLAGYRQAVLWLSDEGVFTLSGVVQIEANAPYVLWVDQVARHLRANHAGAARTLTSQDLPEHLAREWADWWPEHALWIPHGLTRDDAASQGASLWLRDEVWTAPEVQRLAQWSEVWWHAFRAKHKTRVRSWGAFKSTMQRWLRAAPDRPWYRQTRVQLTLLLVVVLLCPLRLSVLAPGELVPAHPVVIRSPLDGVIDTFHVQPNQMVKQGQPLFSFDQALIRSRMEVAQQTLATAQADYRQTYQQALIDAKSKAQLALLAGKVEEKRAELVFATEQQQRATVQAPQGGMVLMDDPSEWIGKPVVVGERILRIAEPGDIEVEAWIPLNDAIALQEGAEVSLYLNASPLSPVSARIRYLAHDAVQRPDGQFAYRVRAVLAEPTSHRVGLKGTARIQGHWVPLIYGMLRRPLASVRTYLGV
ncbi:MAG: HlyD family efflux transporter periplasmic adaptor subunit [Limnohabitans sp.]|nr:HlyD family efflux transporter periplasmic adaptor subunit [Limnohabitans sp.]